MVLASDNLTRLPTPQLTTREQPFHTNIYRLVTVAVLTASYWIAGPYTIIAFLFFGAFRFRVLRESIEKTRRYTCTRKLPLNFNTISGIARMVTRGSAARGRTASESTARETGESSAHQIDKKHASIPRSHVVTYKRCWRSNASSPSNCSTRGASIRVEMRAEL
jgi:hypothetical protein